MTKRGRNEGSIYQLKDGRWCAAISLGTDATGRRKRRRLIAKTHREVKDKLQKMQLSIAGGTYVSPSKTTLIALLERWLKDTVKPNLKANTYASYEITVQKHIAPRPIANTKLTALQPAHIQALIAKLDEEKKGVRTIQNVKLVLNRALSQARKWNMIAANPCDVIEAPKRKKRIPKTWTVEHAIAFLKAAQHDRLWALYVLAIDGGFRQGELFALKWPDIDLAKATVSVQRNLVEISGKISEDTPKEDDSVHLVAIGPTSVRALKEHKKAMLAEGNSASTYVFCAPEGGALRKSNFRRRSFNALLKKSGVPRIVFHSLRHTCASLLLSEGVHPKVVQERLGHADIRVTMDTYSHVLPTMQREAANLLDALLWK